MRKRSLLFLMGIACLAFFVTSCAATKTLIKKRKLLVETKMSETIFLDPVSPEQRVAYVDIRNTSDKDLPEIESGIKGKIVSNGYKITEDPVEANFILQANILQVGKSNADEANSMLGDGYQGVIEGAVLGGVIGGAIGGDVDDFNKGTVIGGVVGAAAGFVFDSLISDVLFTMITDIQVSTRPIEGEFVQQTENTDASQGTATRVSQTSSVDNVRWKIYRTRVVSVANKSNLDFEQAKPYLQSGLVNSIGGIF